MHINLSKEFISFIDRNVESGFYANSAEVVREALRRMKTDSLREEYLREQLQIGLDQLSAGMGKTLDIERIKKEALKELSQKQSPKINAKKHNNIKGSR